MCFLKVIASNQMAWINKSSLKPIDSMSERHASDRSSLGDACGDNKISCSKICLKIHFIKFNGE